MPDRRPPPRPGLYRGPVTEVQAQPVSEPRPAVRPPPEAMDPPAAPPAPLPAPVRVERGTSPSEFERREKARTQTILAVAGLITALFGGAGIGSVYQRDREGITREQAAALREDIRQVGSDVREIRDHLRAQYTQEELAHEWLAQAIAQLNGGPPHPTAPAGGDWLPQPLERDRITGGPTHRTRDPYPRLSRPP